MAFAPQRDWHGIGHPGKQRMCVKMVAWKNCSLGECDGNCLFIYTIFAHICTYLHMWCLLLLDRLDLLRICRCLDIADFTRRVWPHTLGDHPIKAGSLAKKEFWFSSQEVQGPQEPSRTQRYLKKRWQKGLYKKRFSNTRFRNKGCQKTRTFNTGFPDKRFSNTSFPNAQSPKLPSVQKTTL